MGRLRLARYLPQPSAAAPTAHGRLARRLRSRLTKGPWTLTITLD
ncbi:hypothetical protein DO72_5886 [Burkholderia pseudomallei]|nr:hypothetical protein DO72_5886 [Burkholderia pseudomallei]